MSDPVPLTGGSASPITHAPRPGTPVIAPTDRLAIGMQVEVQVLRLLGADQLDVRIQASDRGQAWSLTTRAHLSGPLPTGSAQEPPLTRAEVVALKPTLALRVLGAQTSASATSDATPGTRAWIGLQLRQHWPEARPLTATLRALPDRLSAAAPPGPAPTATAMDPAIGASLQKSVSTLLGRLAGHEDLTSPERLASTLRSSGIWLEASLAQAATNLSPRPELALDLKAQLLALAHQLRALDPGHSGARPPTSPPTTPPPTTAPEPSPAPEVAKSPTEPDATSRAPSRTPEGPPTERAAPRPLTASMPRNDPSPAQPSAPTQAASARAEPRLGPEPQTGLEPRLMNQLSRDVEGMVKQILTHQLQSLDPTAPQPHWTLELPFRTPVGLLALQTEIEREPERRAGEEARWRIRIDLDLPRLGPLTIRLRLQGDQLTAGLHTVSELGASTFQQHLAKLRAQLEARDIEVAALHAGRRPAEPPAPPFDAQLVSEQA